MVGGNSRVNMDLPPYFLYSGFNAEPEGLNVVGLRRADFPAADVRTLKGIYRLLFRAGLKLEEALRHIVEQHPGPLAEHVVRFIRSSKRGIARERVSEESR
jgi:UDP-N-acetylglucosamine acyltransferase